MNIQDALKESCVLAELKGGTKVDALRELAHALKDAGAVEDEAETLRVILERENLGSTGIGDGIAIPHGKMKGLKGILCAFGRSKEGIPFDAVDKKPVRIVFLLLAPEDSAGQHLKMLSRISRILRDQAFRSKLTGEGSASALYKDILEEDKKFSG